MSGDRFRGCLLGLALGDSLGAPHEGGPVERLLWAMIGRTRKGERRWTDDTQMSLDLARSLLACKGLDLDHLALAFAGSYRWSRGYGPGAAKLLGRIGRGVPWREANRSVFASGSFGNGGAMRAPVIGLYFAQCTQLEIVAAAEDSASVTHAHPLGIQGAALIACATSAALGGARSLELLDAAASSCNLQPYLERLASARAWLEEGQAVTPKQVRAQLGNRIVAAESCVTALYLAVRFLEADFLELLAFAAACGGDVDTISSMAGAIWGAARGAGDLPEAQLARLEQREVLESVADSMQRAVEL
ncbi:MAG: poly(ADP-ribose) glycohydrolase ARH3 [Planctomycetota bacterium]|jgi:poly(ADP-ribose) glycohydrolase ARH3